MAKKLDLIADTKEKWLKRLIVSMSSNSVNLTLVCLLKVPYKRIFKHSALPRFR